MANLAGFMAASLSDFAPCEDYCEDWIPIMIEWHINFLVSSGCLILIIVSLLVALIVCQLRSRLRGCLASSFFCSPCFLPLGSSINKPPYLIYGKCSHLNMLNNSFINELTTLNEEEPTSTESSDCLMNNAD
jgi:hypothetical protein